MSICHVFDYSKIGSKVILAGAGAWGGGSQSTPKGYRVHVVCQVSLLIHLTLLKHQKIGSSEHYFCIVLVVPAGPFSPKMHGSIHLSLLTSGILLTMLLSWDAGSF